MAEKNTTDKKGVREVFLSQGFYNDTLEILLESWKKTAISIYSLYTIKWFKFASCNLNLKFVSPVRLTLAPPDIISQAAKIF